MTTKTVPIKLETAAYFAPPKAGYLLIEGPDRLDFIQRQTTNDLSTLNLKHSVTTVLTSPTARILDVLQVLLEPKDKIGAIPLPRRAALTAEYLQERIFFMDKVTITDVSQGYFQVYLEGRYVKDFLHRLGIEAPALNQVVAAEIGNVPIRLVGQKGLAGLGVRLLVDSTAETTLISGLEDIGLEAISSEAYEILRVEAGLPSGDYELTQDFTPLETNLDSLVSTAKGCFTGQEVLARQITYDKISRRMVGLRLEEMVPRGASVSAEGRPAGTVTSVVNSPRFGYIALAVVKRPHHEPGSEVFVSGENRETKAEVCELPFFEGAHV